MKKINSLRVAHRQLRLGHLGDAAKTANDFVQSGTTSAEELILASLILGECGASPSDLIDILRQATQLEPTSEIASTSLFHALWKVGDFKNAVDEMNRFVSREIDFQVKVDSTTESRVSRGLLPRNNSNRNPLDQLRGIEKQQQNIRDKGYKGIIDSIEKSKQQVEHELKRIRSFDDANDSPITFSRNEPSPEWMERQGGECGKEPDIS